MPCLTYTQRTERLSLIAWFLSNSMEAIKHLNYTFAEVLRLHSNVISRKVCKKTYLSWVWDAERNIGHSGSLFSSDPRDGFFYPLLMPMKDTYNLTLEASFLTLATEFFHFWLTHPVRLNKMNMQATRTTPDIISDPILCRSAKS